MTSHGSKPEARKPNYTLRRIKTLLAIIGFVSSVTLLFTWRTVDSQAATVLVSVVYLLTGRWMIALRMSPYVMFRLIGRSGWLVVVRPRLSIDRLLLARRIIRSQRQAGPRLRLGFLDCVALRVDHYITWRYAGDFADALKVAQGQWAAEVRVFVPVVAAETASFGEFCDRHAAFLLQSDALAHDLRG